MGWTRLTQPLLAQDFDIAFQVPDPALSFFHDPNMARLDDGTGLDGNWDDIVDGSAVLGTEAEELEEEDEKNSFFPCPCPVFWPTHIQSCKV